VGLYLVYLTDNVLPRTMFASYSDEFRLVALCLVLPIVMVVITTQALVYWRQVRHQR
jgi:cation:H+ antiporter